MHPVRLYTRYVGTSIRSQMQYRASFIMLTLGHLFATSIEFIGLLVLFDRFDTLRGWHLAEIAFFYGTVNIAFALADAVSRGFDLFATTVKMGDFDRLLLRPRSTVLQLAGQELTLKRIGRFAQGFAILLWSAWSLDLAWTPGKIALTTAAILGAAALFYGLVVLQATLAFWTTETLEIMNTVTYGGVETAQYPLSIYRPWFRKFFTYVVPLAFANYFPILAILDRPDPLGYPSILGWLAPAAGFLFITVSLRAWNFGVRHYQSTGS